MRLHPGPSPSTRRRRPAGTPFGARRAAGAARGSGAPGVGRGSPVGHPQGRRGACAKAPQGVAAPGTVGLAGAAAPAGRRGAAWWRRAGGRTSGPQDLRLVTPRPMAAAGPTIRPPRPAMAGQAGGAGCAGDRRRVAPRSARRPAGRADTPGQARHPLGNPRGTIPPRRKAKMVNPLRAYHHVRGGGPERAGQPWSCSRRRRHLVDKVSSQTETDRCSTKDPPCKTRTPNPTT